MSYAKTTQKLNEYRARIAELHAEMREIQANIEPEDVGDYEFTTPGGPASAGSDQSSYLKETLTLAR